MSGAADWFSAAMRPSTVLSPGTVAAAVVLLLSLLSTSLAIKSTNGDGCILKNATGYESIRSLGDVNVEVGSDAFVDCVLSNSSRYTSKHLNWSGGVSEIIDDRTLRLLVPTASMDNSNMKRKCVNTAIDKGVCIVSIKTGTKPKEVEDFSCTGVNMEYLDCTWRVPKNIYTNYSLVVLINRAVQTYPCKAEPRGRFRTVYGCNFTMVSNDQMYFVYAVPNYTLEMTGTNVFGTRSWIYSFNHHSRVRPKAVIQLEARPVDSRTVHISWEKPKGMQANYAPNVTYFVRYRSEWGMETDWMNVSDNSKNIADLQPFTTYVISVSCLSIAANSSDKSLWSPVASVNVTTPADVPDVPPEVTNGSFFVVSDFSYRNVTLYWKSINDYQKNGDMFTYYAMARRLGTEDGDEPIVTGTEVDEGSAQFTNLSLNEPYLFSIYSENRVGRSERSSEVVLPAKDKMLHKPDSLTVIAINPNQYNVSWIEPAVATGVDGYTLFYTSTDKLFHKNYKGYLSWVTTDASTRNLLIAVPEKYPHHYFAVATYGSVSSSDMLWNTCIVSYNGTVGKLKKIWVGRLDSTSATVQWSIDCAEKLGIIRGYNVHYCVVDDRHPETCTGKQQRHHVAGANMDKAQIENLLPFTPYKVAVSVETLKAQSEISSAVHFTTDEAVPLYAANDIQIPEHTNSSFLLKWHPPTTPNGLIRGYQIIYDSGVGKKQTIYHEINIGLGVTATCEFNVTDNIQHEVAPYTNYTVALRACTKKGCSNMSEPITVQTDIGVPGQMEPPQARLVNLSHALIQPEMRDSVNGPELVWELKLEVVDGANATLADYVKDNLTDTMLYVPINCEQPDFKEAVVQLRTRASNVKDGELLFGPWSDYTKISCLSPMYPVSTIIAVVGGATLALIFIVILSIFISRRVKLIIEKYKIKVALPTGLEGADNYTAFNAGMKQRCYMDNAYSKGELICGSSPNSRLLKSESRTRNISNETSRSTTSSELLLLQDQRGKGNWADESMASANNDSISSRPSTTQTHLSSDSSIELTPSVPESPDSVFGEHPLKNPSVSQLAQAVQAPNNFNPTLTPIGESQDGGGSSRNSTPQHYSRFAGYYDPKDGREGSLTPVDGAASSSYVAAPYSQFGMAADNWPNANPPDPDWTRSEDPHPLSYSKLGLTIPAFDEPPLILKPGAANGGPVTSTPTRSTAGYSVLGMGDETPTFTPPPATAAKGYVMAAMLNDDPVFVAPSTSKRDDPADYVSMDSHKRSPSNASSSLTAGYCRFGLSRPTSVSSESGHYVPADPALCPSPSKAGSCRTSVEVPSSSSHHSIHGSDGAAAADEQQMSDAELHTPNGYATVQQLLKSDGNS